MIIATMGRSSLSQRCQHVISAASPEVARKLRDRLMSTVQIVITHEGSRQVRTVKPVDFEEVSTIRQVMDKIFKVNFDFLTIAGE